MFGKIAAFELRYQFRNPVFWVVAILFFLLTFGAATSENLSIGDGGNVNANSPAALAETTIILTIFFMFVTTAFVANVIVRDDESGFGPMVRSTRVSKFDYLIGRFTGAFGISAIAFLTVPFAIWLGSYMPWMDPETLGPNRLSHFLYAYFLLALPGIFLTSCLFFAVATITRSMMYSYMGVVVFLVLYLAFSAATEFDPELMLFSAYAEPFGGGAYEYLTRYWTAAESNSMMAPFDGVLLVNRLIWLAVSIAALAFAYSRFSFADAGISKRQIRKQQEKMAALAKEEPVLVAALPQSNPAGAAWSRLLTRTRFEMTQVFKSPAFFILVLIGLFNSVAALFFFTELYGTPAYPRTFYVIGILEGSFTIFPLIIAIFYGGELVWRDRDRKMHEIIDSTPIPNWAFMVPKTLAVVGVLFTALMISVVAAMLIQLSKGYTDFELGKYWSWYILPGTVEMVTLAILSVFVQALSPNKYIGWGIMVLYMVATITFNIIGWNHPLYLFNKGIPVPLSDMNGDMVGASGAWWLRLYWGAFAVMLAALAHLIWRRGTETSLMPRIRQLPRRLISPAGALIAVAAAVALGTGIYIYNAMNVQNRYLTLDDTDKLSADYENKYLKYESVKQPSVTDVKMNIGLYPEQQRMNVVGTIRIVNDTGAPVEALHVTFTDQNTKIDALDIPASKLEMFDEEMQYRIYRLNEPMAIGETRTLGFETSRERVGFKASGNEIRLLQNGTFLNNTEFMPTFGMNRNGLLSDRAKRRKYGLPAELRLPKLEDKGAREKNYVNNVDWVMSDITVSTAKDQTPIAPGSKVSDEVKGDRRIARFVSTNPILAFFSVQSARYAVEQRSVDGVDISVYYHPDHDYNIKTMVDATEKSLAYYKKNFGPYQFDYARILEFPGYESFAQAFAGTVPYSERIGFLANISDPENIDYVTYVTAHEIGHQYWAHQLISAYQQGGTLLVETMAQYSALMVMKELYGEDKIRRFLKYELDNYLNARGSEAVEELPLNRVEDQGYIHYRKGSVVMYLLQDRLGENRVNAMLANLLDKYRFKSQPYASSIDLVNGFKSLARNDAERQLVVDLLEKITVYDMKVDTATVRKLADGKFETTLTVKADKYYADGEGKETKASLADNIEIGLFTAKPGIGAFGKNDVISMARKPLKSGKQVIKVISKKKPEYVGVDPYNKYIDRNSDDNVIAVTAG
ncbi:ABC transporter permease/M1 family aminopeptidase [Parasphingorhabdus halotolerans]|uniref:ABC transporter permease n=1 Tax=Parasphingorhabdus halotolerans TaxID=2725558 RepID=A0A6H2DLG9_9SPHN|nr:M1 family aminopeptidase [Parasphingorhabdus halotolerans]QJB69509.1 ABC transporter permease [Parasphingorhabdus halotolerans]